MPALDLLPDHAHQAPASARTVVVADPDHRDSFDNGLISRFNAWFFTAFAWYVNLVTRPHKDAAFAGLAGADDALELGAGTGANFARLSPGAHLFALEPSEAMHPRLRERAREAGIDLTLLPARAEAIPLPDASVDEVFASLVLCTVGDPDQALSEIVRVLRPGGRFRFVEHVAAPSWSPRHWVQRLVSRPWSWLFEGCDSCRDTASHLAQAGFDDLDVQRRKLRLSLFWPVNTTIHGIATK